MTGAEVFGRAFEAGWRRYWHGVRASKGGILLRAPEEWMEKGANETTPPDAAGAAKSKKPQGSLV